MKKTFLKLLLQSGKLFFGSWGEILLFYAIVVAF